MEIEQLQQEIIALKREKRVHEAQNKLFEVVINMAISHEEEQVLTVTMQNALDIAVEFSGAQKASLFLLDKKGVVTDSILSRDKIRGEKRSSLIGKVLESGLAGWVKQTLSAGLIVDTKTDTRWLTLAEQSYVVRSAIAVPLLRHDTLFGILTLMHPLPSYFDQRSVDIAQQTANQMAIAIENAQLYRKLEQSKKSLESAKQSIEKYSRALNDELKKGKKIQKDFLPRFLPKVNNCDISSYFHPALQLSGDFYDMFELPNNHIGFVIGDVSGKGVGSALFMALTRSLLRIFSGPFFVRDERGNDADSNENFSPEDALNAVFLTNEYLSKEHCEDGMFVTLFFCVIDPLTGNLFYVNGGHEPVFIIGENGIKKSLTGTGPALGPIQGAIYGIETIRLGKGDMLFGYTDGVTDARSETRDFYTRARLRNLIDKGFYGSTEVFLEMIKTDLFEFAGEAPQSDDITMLALKWY